MALLLPLDFDGPADLGDDNVFGGGHVVKFRGHAPVLFQKNPAPGSAGAGKRRGAGDGGSFLPRFDID